MNKRALIVLIILALVVPFTGQVPPARAVTTQTTLVYDFVANAASASWKTSAVPISFGGPNTDARGFAMYASPATMEDGTNQRRVLETHPQWVSTGWIEGSYYNITIPSGATLNLKAGFLKGATGSNGVLYSVRFQEKGTTTWYYFPDGTTAANDGHLKTYDTKLWSGSWSLKDLAGKTGQFVLRVSANGNSGQDWACWQQADITALSVPGAVEAHAEGSNITIDWEYTYTSSLLTSLSFEVQTRGILPIWLSAGTVAYPATTLTLTDQGTGQHSYRVRAVEKFTLFVTTTTYSDWSASAPAWVLAAPSGTAVERVENTMNVRVGWTGIDAAATGYQVLRTTNPLLRPPVVHEGLRTDTSWIDTGLSANMKYYYYVRAIKTGTESDDKDVSSMLPMLSITTPPESPAAQVAHSSGKTITVSWTHSGNCAEFHVWSKPVSVAEPVMPAILPSTQRSFTIADAAYGKWMVDMAARGEGGYSPDTPTMDVWVLTTPSAPIATVAGATTIDLSWGAPDANATTVRILRSTAEGPFVSLATVAAGVTAYADTACLAGTSYAYRLQAARDDDVSEQSPASTRVTTSAAPTRPARPADLVAVAQSSSSVGLAWSDNAVNETIYRVYRKNASAAAFNQTSPDLPAGTVSWQDTTVAASSSYVYIVKAVNAVGESDPSNEASVTTPAASISVPAAPTNLAAAAASSSAVALTWTDNATDESAYIVERATGAGAFAAVASDLAAGTVQWNDTGVTASTAYRYRVKARNAGGDSAWSNEASVTTPAGVQITVIKLVIDKKDYTVNGVPMQMDVAPVILEGRTLGPVRYIAEALGASVAWNPSERKVTVSMGSKTIEMWIGRNSARVDGTYMLIDPGNPDVMPVILPPGRTMLPFRFIAEQLGAGVGWDPVKREVTITYPAP